MINPTTARYLTKSYAADRGLEAARDRRVASVEPTCRPGPVRPPRFTAAARFAAHLPLPFRHQLAPR